MLLLICNNYFSTQSSDLIVNCQCVSLGFEEGDEQITYPFPNIVFTQAEEEAASHETFSSNCDSENNLSFPISRELLPSNLLPHSNLRYK